MAIGHGAPQAGWTQPRSCPSLITSQPPGKLRINANTAAWPVDRSYARNLEEGQLVERDAQCFEIKI